MMHGCAKTAVFAVTTFLLATAFASPSSYAATAPATHTIEQPSRVEQLAVDSTRIYWSAFNVVYSYDLTTGQTSTALIAPPGYFISRLVADNGTIGAEADLVMRRRTKTIIYRIDNGAPRPRRVATSSLKTGRRYTCGKLTQLGDVSPNRLIVLITHTVRQRHPRCHNRRNLTEIFISGRRATGKIGQRYYFDTFRSRRAPFYSKYWGYVTSVDAELHDAVIGGNSVQYTRNSWETRFDEIEYFDPDDPDPIFYTPDLSPSGRLITPGYNYMYSSFGEPTGNVYVQRRKFKQKSRWGSIYEEDPNPEGFIADSNYAAGMRFCGERVLGFDFDRRKNRVGAALMAFVWPSVPPTPPPSNAFMFWANKVAEGTLKEGADQLVNAACDESRVVSAVNNSTTGRAVIAVHEIAALAPSPWPVLP